MSGIKKSECSGVELRLRLSNSPLKRYPFSRDKFSRKTQGLYLALGKVEKTNTAITLQRRVGEAKLASMQPLWAPKDLSLL